MFFFLSKFVPSMTFNMYWLHHSINLLKIVPFLGGWLSDRLLGDPEGWPHPIVWFGKAISAGEKALNKGSERALKGGILAVVLILGVYLICERILSWAWIIHPQFSGLLTAVGVFYCLSGKTLIKEVKAVFEAVDRSTEEGRRQVARSVGRDTSNLVAARDTGGGVGDLVRELKRRRDRPDVLVCPAGVAGDDGLQDGEYTGLDDRL